MNLSRLFHFLTRYHPSCSINSSQTSPLTSLPSSWRPTPTITRSSRCWCRKVCRSPSLMRCAVTAWSASPIQAWTVCDTHAPVWTSTRPWPAPLSSPCPARILSSPPSSSAGSSRSSAKLKTSSRPNTRSAPSVQALCEGPPGPNPVLTRTGVDPQFPWWCQPSARGGQQWAGSTEIGHQIPPKRGTDLVLQSCIVEVKSYNTPLESGKMWIILPK